MPSFLNLCSLSSLVATIPAVIAGYSSSSTSNLAVYWGQNSYGQATGSALSQQRLSYYCANSDIDIIPLAFLTVIGNPALNFANAGDLCTAISGSNLFYCSELETDITECQTTYGKTILLSVGGSTYSEGGFSTSAAAVTAANNIWADFGPYSSSSSAPRPFGKAVIDGFDFDFESTVSNMPAFGNQLRSLMDADKASTGKNWLLTAAPQCPYPDSADNPMLDGTVFFDIVWIQFYNNYCGIQSFTTGTSTQNNFNFATWDTWAKTVSKNPNVKLMLGVPANTGAGAGYQTPSALAPIISYCKSFSSFAGVMVWDMTQAYANSGFLDGVKSDLGVAVTITTTAVTSKPAMTLSTVTTKATSVAATTTTSPPATTGVAQWGQCGGIGYTGPTTCVSPYSCFCTGAYWCQCE